MAENNESNIVRVYHPTITAWYDVPKKEVESWTALGWLEEKPDGFDDQDEKQVPPGGGYRQPTVVIDNREEAPAPAGNASLEEWKRYASSQGATEADLENATRDQLRSEYGSSDATSTS